MAVETRHTRYQMKHLCSCSHPGCPYDTQPGEHCWQVRGDVEYDALCAKCHARMFPAIDYAVTKDE